MFGLFKFLELPLSKNRFKVKVVDSDWPDEWSTMLGKQIVSCDMSLTKKTVSLIAVQKNKSPNMMDIIAHLLSKDVEKSLIEQMNVQLLGSNAFEATFITGRIIHHNLNMDYTKKGDLAHELVFEFDKVKIINGQHNLSVL